MDDMPGISQAEWTVMQVVWRGSPLSATEVFEALEDQCDWHPKTVRTLLGRLVSKGALSREKRGGVYRFTPRVTEEECVREEGRTFLDRCFGGSPRPMLAHFIEHEDLSDEDVEALRTMLNDRAAKGNQR